MELLRSFIDLFLHLDQHLSRIIADYGVWTHLILFLIVFAETGLVVTPFLPGDSLLFAAGSFAALGALDLWLLVVLLYFFGNIPAVRKNFTLVILAIVALSVVPILVEAMRARRSRPA